MEHRIVVILNGMEEVSRIPYILIIPGSGFLLCDNFYRNRNYCTLLSNFCFFGYKGSLGEKGIKSVGMQNIRSELLNADILQGSASKRRMHGQDFSQTYLL